MFKSFKLCSKCNNLKLCVYTMNSIFINHTIFFIHKCNGLCLQIVPNARHLHGSMLENTASHWGIEKKRGYHQCVMVRKGWRSSLCANEKNLLMSYRRTILLHYLLTLKTPFNFDVKRLVGRTKQRIYLDANRRRQSNATANNIGLSQMSHIA